MVALAEGSEDLETVTIVDVLRRAQANVTIAKVGNQSLKTKMICGTVIEADCIFD